MEKCSSFTEKVEKHFDFLVKDFGYSFQFVQESERNCKLKYVSVKKNREIVIENDKDPRGDGFSIFIYRNKGLYTTQGGCILNKSYYAQDNEDEYLLEFSTQLQNGYKSILNGESWMPEFNTNAIGKGPLTSLINIVKVLSFLIFVWISYSFPDMRNAILTIGVLVLAVYYLNKIKK